jgi:superfamily II DNA or RNA helicase
MARLTMARASFEYNVVPGGVDVRLTRRAMLGTPAVVPVDEWTSVATGAARPGMARVLSALDADDGSVVRRGDALGMTDAFVASLTETQAIGLGLPPSVPFMLDVQAHGRFMSPEFSVATQWLEHGRPVWSERRGTILVVGDDEYRIPSPLFQILGAVDLYRAAPAGDESARIKLVASLQEQLPQDGADNILLDQYLRSFRVQHAAAFSLTLRTEGAEFSCDPILFGRRVHKRASGGEIISESEALLTPHQQDIFAVQRFGAFEDARAVYTIERGLYVHVDPALQKALGVVRRVQRAPSDIRRNFARNPQVYLKDALGDEVAEATIEQLFIETEQYSRRVIDIGVWHPPVLPWIKPEPNHWLPEKFGLLIKDAYVQLSTVDVTELRALVTSAMAAGEPTVPFKGESIPATSDTLHALTSLTGATTPAAAASGGAGGKPEAAANQKHVLIVDENFETTTYRGHNQARGNNAHKHIPSIVKPLLKPHQLGGLSWLQDAWLGGSNGVLLADDMGLGKTLQALAFLAWLKSLPLAARDGTLRPRSPVLVVATTGLLSNWSDEHELHLSAPGLGEVCRAYGRHLAALRASQGRDVDLGVPALDRRHIQQADWVLTTYETLRDYHVSFGGIRFGCAIFDEVQKAKNPSSLLTHAVKSVNADFIIGLTGTPIENRMEDLWSIMDIVDPGRLGDLKSFSAKYSSAEVAVLEELRNKLLRSADGAPAPILRRLKSDELEGLPKKTPHARRRPMPEVQAQAYAQVVAQAKNDEGFGMLQALHGLRSVSLHPMAPSNTTAAQREDYIGGSARTTELFSILDVIAAQREKALIFLESLELQDYLALMIKERFALAERPLLINGQVTGELRQNRVRAFQQRRGVFDVMILSPRAGGVGLTLTAANHVIHLSRWWNPAVEDQCTDRVYRIGQTRDVHVYFPMAIHPNFGEGSFDALLDSLLERKRELSRRMLIPPVSREKDQAWFAERLRSGMAKRPASMENMDEIDAMEAQQFERWVLSRLAGDGWEVDKTPITHDAGADGISVHRGRNLRIIVQCKHRQSSNTVCTDDVVDELLRARERYGIEAQLVGVTNAKSFSSAVIARAKLHEINLVSRGNLIEWPYGIV